MKFSQRIGKKPVKTLLQVESIDIDLRNRLWNVILESFFLKLRDYSNTGENQQGVICKHIWREFFTYPIDRIPSFDSSGKVYFTGFINFLREWFYKAQWYEVYDIIEFISYLDSRAVRVGFIQDCNSALEKEVSGYRIVNEKVAQITSSEEVQEVEDAIDFSSKWNSVNTHLRASLDLLSDRKNPDYRNSIKESISAVESFCILVTGDDNTTLGKALIEIEKKHSLHKALKNAFSALYGYTSDSGGIRHALIETDITVGFEDAKFMLVSCSSFINYLKIKLNM